MAARQRGPNRVAPGHTGAVPHSLIRRPAPGETVGWCVGSVKVVKDPWVLECVLALQPNLLDLFNSLSKHSLNPHVFPIPSSDTQATIVSWRSWSLLGKTWTRRSSGSRWKRPWSRRKNFNWDLRNGTSGPIASNPKNP